MNFVVKKRALALVTSFILLISFMLVGCSGSKNAQNDTISPSSNVNQAKIEVKNQPDTMTKLKIGLPATTLLYWPWYLADKKGFFKKHNLEIEFVRVDSSVLALRGLSSGDFKFITSTPESIITGVTEGAKVKFIGAITAQSVNSILASPEINNVNDLKGKTAGTYQPGSGIDLQLRFWLKKNGLEPYKDIRIVNAGGGIERFTALKTGTVKATILNPPYNFEAEKAGFKQIGQVRDVLKTYNHDMIIARGTVLSTEPELARALMAATSEAIEFIKNSANRNEVLKIGMEITQSSQEIAEKSLDFLLPIYPDKGKLNEDGIDFTIKALQELGELKKDITIKDLYDSSFYLQN